MDTITLYQYLDNLSVQYDVFEHKAVYTSDEARRLTPQLPGISAKNLFLRDKKGKQFFMLVIPDWKEVNLIPLADRLGVNRLSLASTTQLYEILRVQPGAVSLLALVNDIKKIVTVIFDRSIWQHENIQLHPLINTATLVIPCDNIPRFLKATGHLESLIEIE
jgi:Ala-tRNA(Pro) deacylase